MKHQFRYSLMVWMFALLLTGGVALARGRAAIGGQLYDAWWKVTGAAAPTGDHPLWARQSTNTRRGADTWRCVECHGWDYRGAEGAYGRGSSHYTGFPGLLKAAQSRSVDELLADLKGRTDPAHDFSSVMEEAQLRLLAEFLKHELGNPALYVRANGAVSGDADHGEVLYNRVCARCHGEDGRAFNFATLEAPAYLGTMAKEYPWEVLHKIRFGQPGTDMPAGAESGWAMQDAADVLAYLQTLPGDRADAELAYGAALYDNWPEALGVKPPTETHPLYPASGAQRGAVTWRCKECHGWDYRGAEGAYARGEHYSGIRGVLSMQGRSYTEALSWLDGSQNPRHDFSRYLDLPERTALARFLSEGLVDTTGLVDAEGHARGDAMRGHMLYTATCAYCHGADGTAINLGDKGQAVYLGSVARENPWEFVHKVRGGQPGTEMPAGLGRGWEPAFAADVLAYAQTLPLQPLGDAPAIGGALYDKWYEVLGVQPLEGEHPLWETQTTNSRSGADTWRCVECHGWDYKGREGAYGPASGHYTGFPGLMNAVHTLSVEEIITVLRGARNPKHDFSPYMGEDNLRKLALFIKYAHVNDDDFIDDVTMKAVGGDLSHGESLYQRVCAECHGEDGTEMAFRDEGYLEYIGTVANDDPWEFLHKSRFGTPGTDMPLGYTLGWSPQDARDILRYAQTLPTGRELPPQGKTVVGKLEREGISPGGPAASWWSGLGTALMALVVAVGVNLLFIGGLVLLVFLLVWSWRQRA